MIQPASMSPPHGLVSKAYRENRFASKSFTAFANTQSPEQSAISLARLVDFGIGLLRVM
jgi:hypothetical protein